MKGRPAEYTDAQIIEAGLALISESKAASGFAIREKIGGGKIERINRIWAEHLAEQPFSEKPQEPVVVTDSTRERIATEMQLVEDKIVTLVGSLNHQAKMDADLRIEEIQTLAENKGKASDQQLEIAAKQIDELESQSAELMIENEEAKTELLELRKEKHQADVSLARLTEKISSSEKELERNRGQIENLQAQDIVQREEIRKLAEAKTAAESNNDYLKRQLEATTANLAAESKKTAELTRDLDSLKNEIQKTDIAFTQAKEHQKHIDQAFDQAKKDLDQAKKTLESEINQHKRTRQELAEIREQAANKAGQLEVLTQQLHQLRVAEKKD